MPPACFNVELIKFANRLAIADSHGIDFATVRLSNRTPHRAGELTQHLCAITAEFQCMPVEPACWSWRKSKGFASAYLDVTPPTLLRETQESISNVSYNVRFEKQRFAKIAKR